MEESSISRSSTSTAFNPGLSLQLSAIKTLNGTNYEDWYESLTVNLAIMNLDMALRDKTPSKLTDKSSTDEKAYYERWEHSNRTCLMIMKYSMDKSIKQSVPKTENAKDFLDAVGKKFTKFDKAEKANYMRLLTSTPYDGVSGVREHIMKLTHYFNKLKDMKVVLADDLLVWQVLESLPSQFNALKTTYNAQKGEWDLSEMTAIVTQEEEALKKGKAENALIVTNESGNFKKKFSKIGNNSKPQFKKKVRKPAQQQVAPAPQIGPKIEVFKGKCNFCHAIGHKRMDCRKFKAWLDKKGIQRQPEAK